MILWRKKVLNEAIQVAVDMSREELWVGLRTLERKHRSQLVASILEKYAQWFLITNEHIEQEILNAVLRIQAVFRGNLARLVMSTKMVNWGNRAKRAQDAT